MFRLLLAVVLAVAAARAVDVLARRRGLDPPGFRSPHRRALASLVLTFTFLVGIFVPATHFDLEPEIDVESLELWVVFQLQILLLLTLAAWLALGYAAVSDRPGDPEAPEPIRPPPRWRRLLGLDCRRPLTEIGLGLAAGLAAWFLVLLAATAVALVLTALGGEGVLERPPPAAIVWMVGLPIGWRLLLSLSAGIVEELFFRGFLQARAGIGLSTVLFVGGHLGYGQPLMLVGLTLLSLFYAWLVRWRGNVWAAAAAHFLFDAVQLLVVLPAALELSRSLPASLPALAFC